MDVATPFGPARVTWHLGPPALPRAVLLLGHGAGGGICAPDLLLVANLARSADFAVGLVEQPYRVAGRRAPAPAVQLDGALTAIVGAAQNDIADPALPLVLGGRSSGGRVACRTARALGARGVIALAFPLQPPRPLAPSRLPELLGAGVPVLVVQGTRDSFGSAGQLQAALDGAQQPASDVVISTAEGADHSLRKGVDAATVTQWLASFLR